MCEREHDRRDNRCSRNHTSERGGGVSARAHACVALGRCVAFGRPKMSVWGHAGAGSPSSKVACISFLTSLFWNLFDGSVSIFLFTDAVGVSTTASPLSAPPRTHVPTHGNALVGDRSGASTSVPTVDEHGDALDHGAERRLPHARPMSLLSFKLSLRVSTLR